MTISQIFIGSSLIRKAGSWYWIKALISLADCYVIKVFTFKSFRLKVYDLCHADNTKWFADDGRINLSITVYSIDNDNDLQEVTNIASCYSLCVTYDIDWKLEWLHHSNGLFH